MARKLRGERVRYFCTLCIDGPDIEQNIQRDASNIEIVLPDLWIPPSTQHIQLIKHESSHIFDTIRKTRALSELEPRQFEYLLAETLHREGYDIWVTPETRDHGRDVIAYRDGMLPLLVVGEAKKMDIVEPVWLRALYGVCNRDKANMGIL
ncbi:MAG TPA: restriction endonuclease, partial [Polyangium sp.]|nr:restriction endonuclease [Polyangium sp.]